MSTSSKSDVRIKAALPTIQAALDQNAAVMVMSHLGSPPKENDLPLVTMSLTLSNHMINRSTTQRIAIKPGELVVCEMFASIVVLDKALSKKWRTMCL